MRSGRAVRWAGRELEEQIDTRTKYANLYRHKLGTVASFRLSAFLRALFTPSWALFFSLSLSLSMSLFLSLSFSIYLSLSSMTDLSLVVFFFLTSLVDAFSRSVDRNLLCVPFTLSARWSSRRNCAPISPIFCADTRGPRWRKMPSRWPRCCAGACGPVRQVGIFCVSSFFVLFRRV